MESLNASFRTELMVDKFPFSIDHHQKILCVGSCFAEHMAKKLIDLKFQVILNPFGILYNPVSILRMFEQLLDEKIYQESDLFQHNELWHSFDHHSMFSKKLPENSLKLINDEADKSRNLLKEAKLIIITLGTGYVFEHIQSNQIVANCHKVPNHSFNRYLLSQEIIYNTLNKTSELILNHNQEAKIIFTVSPIRHIRDGLVDNQVSKASLLLSVNQLTKQYEQVYYFPAYEIMMDDLRDYRFYMEDMIHPTHQAINYIWEKFKRSLLSTSALALAQVISKITKASLHRSFHPQSESHQKFIQMQLLNIQKLEQEHPFLDFFLEKSIFNSQISV
ncbi:MAG: GSCFA domain-containing protein [Bacteroidota bacterium]